MHVKCSHKHVLNEITNKTCSQWGLIIQNLLSGINTEENWESNPFHFNPVHLIICIQVIHRFCGIKAFWMPRNFIKITRCLLPVRKCGWLETRLASNDSKHQSSLSWMYCVILEYYFFIGISYFIHFSGSIITICKYGCWGTCISTWISSTSGGISGIQITYIHCIIITCTSKHLQKFCELHHTNIYLLLF